MDVIVVSLPFSPNARQFLSAGLTPLASRSRHKIQRGGIHAVAQACGRRPVVKHVSQVSAASRAMDFGPWMEQLPIRLRANGLFANRFPEARPASAAVVLGVGGEPGQVASGAVIGARVLARVVLAATEPLCPFLA